MSIKFQSDSAGTGVFTVKTPASNSNRTLTLPDTTTTLVGEGTMLTTMTAKAYNWNGLTTNTVLDFTDIPSWVKRITVMLHGLSVSGTSHLLVQIGSGSIQTSGYVSAAGYAGGSSSAGSVTSTAGYIVHNGNIANLQYLQMYITNFNEFTWNSAYTGMINPTGYLVSGGGGVTLSGSLDVLRITTVNGTDTFDAGTVNVMYEG